MKGTRAVKYFKALGKASLIVKKEREIFPMVLDELERADKIMDKVREKHPEEKYAHLEDKIKEIKEKVNRKFRDLEP